MSELTFDEFQRINKDRREKKFQSCATWKPSDWALAIAGESGELCNIMKKVIRGDFTLESHRKDILKEIADVITYCDALIGVLGSSTSEVLATKFDEVSKRVGYVERILPDVVGGTSSPRPQESHLEAAKRLRPAIFDGLNALMNASQWNVIERGMAYFAELRTEAPRQPSQDGMILVNAAEYNALRECMVGAADDAIVLSKRLSVLVQQWRESADKSEDHIGRDRDENGNSRNENECHMRDMRMCADKLEEILKAEHSEPAKETPE